MRSVRGCAESRERSEQDPWKVFSCVWNQARKRPKQGKARGRAEFSISRHLSLERDFLPQKRDSLSA
jgi:hypothetical protein